MAITTQIVLESHDNTIECIVTQIMLLQQLYLLFPNYVATNEVRLLLLKLRDYGKIIRPLAGAN
jgi:hypothetical protein